MSQHAVDLRTLFDTRADLDPRADPPLDFHDIPHVGGIYLLVDGAGRRVQLAGTGRLRETLTKRLAPVGRPSDAGTDTHGPQLDLLAVTRTVYWSGAQSQFEQFYRYARVARALDPAGYRQELAFQPAWFLHVDAAQKFPEFRRVRRLFERAGQYLGPFRDRSAAGLFAETLIDLFSLCRHYDILRRAPEGTACAYKQIGKCPAPCDGSVGLDRYAASITHAVEAAAGRNPAIRDDWAARMHHAGTELDFERAAALKKQLEKLDGLRTGHFRFVAPAEDFNYVVIQRHRGRKTLRPFFVRRGVIVPGEPFAVREARDRLPQWSEVMAAPPPQTDPEVRADCIALVTHFLFRRSDPGLYWRFLHNANWAELPAKIEERFAPSKGDGKCAGNT